MSKMENKSLSRSHYSGFDAQPGVRKHQQRKPHKKSQNVICDGRVHGPGPGGSNQDHGYPLFNNRSVS